MIQEEECQQKQSSFHLPAQSKTQSEETTSLVHR